MVSFACAVILLVAMPGLALKARPAREPIGRLESIPMMTYKQDCWKKRPVSLAQVPGAGINEFEPFELVEKDGYYSVACVKDYMFYFGDKFGDNKHDYKLGSVSNVSIVHYDAHVPKEDRETMTEKVCFRFCRTVPDMLFFGIVNGRDCYCAPYYKPMESDSSSCDVVCPGKPTTTCGGETKSSIFQMHMCNDAEEDLNGAVGRAEEMITELESRIKVGKEMSDAMQKSGAELQKVFGKVGDPGASDLMQSAKVFAGKMAAATRVAGKDKSKIEDLKGGASEITDFKKPSELTKSEKLIEDLEDGITEAVMTANTLDDLLVLGTGGTEKKGAAEQYYPIMYFVDAKEDEHPSTCVGDAVAEPIVGDSMDGCASACDAAESSDGCVGFSYFQVGEYPPVCFLMSKFKSVTYYTGCSEIREPELDPFEDLIELEEEYLTAPPPFYDELDKPAYEGEPYYPDLDKKPVLLQKKNTTKFQVAQKHDVPKSLRALVSDVRATQTKVKRPDVTCFAKLSAFSGTTLKPDRSGKCKQCLKKVTDADRCYE
eukprot:gnl/TRDRNA2_/TRDRNA2_84066_c0_seq1.p1 gnl/TRDRNA2_/TRDRNA2_84066_c0~~gnl/TRDRNA2_/TRDRNA2_84066_c0_seq1.p1  ORF type:complete len:568 (+),score=121.25 gnl/TRDRNA2_/TRDRNA2_84066_c0_seq1:78-1706(+)